MNTKNTLALSILTAALTLAAPAVAQTMQATPAMPAPAMKASDTMMKAVPAFAFSTQSGMNMMMNSGGAVEIAAAPGEKLVSRSVKGTAATLVYAGKNSASIFAFYDRAIKAEGWKTTAMDGKMMAEGAMMKSGDSMAKPTDTMAASTMSAKPADTMAKPADTMAKPATMTSGAMNSGTMNSGAMMGGTHSATFAMGGHTIDLNVRESAGRVTVTFKSK
ncbi:hypothetical protein [Deinococcus altitudinis]|uniref:hypothetical protein n=1 Tax=Deinococcus altitudinis TaxID=468914 RepID=UPI00389131FA